MFAETLEGASSQINAETLREAQKTRPSPDQRGLAAAILFFATAITATEARGDPKGSPHAAIFLRSLSSTALKSPRFDEKAESRYPRSCAATSNPTPSAMFISCPFSLVNRGVDTVEQPTKTTILGQLSLKLSLRRYRIRQLGHKEATTPRLPIIGRLRMR